MHPQDITLATFYFVGDVNSAKDALETSHHIIEIEVEMTAARNDEAAGWLSHN